MKKLQPFFFFLFVSSFLLIGHACTKEKKENSSSLIQKKLAPSTAETESTFYFDIPQTIDNSKKISSLLELKEMISLDLGGDLIGAISDVFLIHDRLVVVDKEVSHSVYLCDKNGKRIKKIGNKGEGPSEYSKISDVKINNYKNSIDLWDSESFKIISYSFDGDFISENRIEAFASNIAPMGKDKYMFFQAGESDPDLFFDIISINLKENKVISKYFPRNQEEERIGYLPPCRLAQNGTENRFFYAKPYDNTIFAFENGLIKDKYVFDFKNRKIPKSELDFKKFQSINDFYSILFDKKYFSNISNVLENKKFLLFNVTNGEKFVHLVFNKKDQKTILFANPLDDIFASALFFKPLFLDENELLIAIDPLIFEELIVIKTKNGKETKEEILSNWKKDMPAAYQLYNQSSQVSNPVLAILKLKI